MANSPAFFTLLSSSMSSSSTTCLPAVSTTTVSYPSAAAFSTASLAISAGSASVPIEKTSTPIDVPRISSCSIAAGRYTSAAQRRTRRLRLGMRLARVDDRSSSDIKATATESTSRSLRYSASLPAAVVLPAPWRPARRMTEGRPSSRHARVAAGAPPMGGVFPAAAAASPSLPAPPIMSRSSSYMALTNCCSAVTPFVTSCPRERRFTPSMRAVATSRLTSASRRARLTDLSAGWMEVSVILPSPSRRRYFRRFLGGVVSFSCHPSTEVHGIADRSRWEFRRSLTLERDGIVSFRPRNGVSPRARRAQYEGEDGQSPPRKI